MSYQRVTFLTIPASAIPRTSRGSGQLLRYWMIIGVQVGRSSVTFKHPDYELQVDPGVRPATESYMMPQLMAARLIPFARDRFVPVGRDYDSGDFALYVSGLQATPAHQARSYLDLSAHAVKEASEMHYHLIGDEGGEIAHSFIGLSGQRALSVLGHRGPFGISPVRDLMRVYDGVVLGRLGETT